jgi:hypothetical protein
MKRENETLVRKKRVLIALRERSSMELMTCLQGCQIFLGTWYQNQKKWTKWTQNGPNGHKISQMSPNVCKIFQMAIKYINIFQSKALQNLPKLAFLIWKETIWQPCLSRHASDGGRCSENRVTRLGEFSPLGRLFTLGSLLKLLIIREICISNFRATFFLRKKWRINLAKMWVGQHAVCFFPHSSGHSGRSIELDVRITRCALFQ